jgi:hypothetical protein
VDARGLADIRATRRRLVDCVSPLWLDLVTINIGLRSQVRADIVHCPLLCMALGWAGTTDLAVDHRHLPAGET